MAQPLTCSATVDSGRVSIRMPDGAVVSADADEVDARLSAVVARPVRLSRSRPVGASVERADPEQVLEFGLDAEVDAPILELAEATPGTSFTDYAPVHVITTATLEQIGTEAQRYRPNLVIATPPGFPAYAENSGPVVPSSSARCGCVPSARRRVVSSHLGARFVAAGSRGTAHAGSRKPCRRTGHGSPAVRGAYLEVVTAGTIRAGDQVTLESS